MLRGASSGGENEWEEKDAHQLLAQDKLSLAVVAGRRLEGTRDLLSLQCYYLPSPVSNPRKNNKPISLCNNSQYFLNYQACECLSSATTWEEIHLSTAHPMQGSLPLLLQKAPLFSDKQNQGWEPWEVLAVPLSPLAAEQSAAAGPLSHCWEGGGPFWSLTVTAVLLSYV